MGIASVASIRGLPGHGAYCASKSAVVAYCESLRGECRPFGVRVVTLLPGYIDTPLTRSNRYSMPFLMTADGFAEQAVRAIRAQVSYRVIPWQMGIVAKLMRLLPNWLYDKLLAGRPRKQRQGGDRSSQLAAARAGQAQRGRADEREAGGLGHGIAGALWIRVHRAHRPEAAAHLVVPTFATGIAVGLAVEVVALAADVVAVVDPFLQVGTAVVNVERGP